MQIHKLCDHEKVRRRCNGVKNSPDESWFADRISSSPGWRRTSIFRRRECSSLVCKKRKRVLEIAIRAISSMVLQKNNQIKRLLVHNKKQRSNVILHVCDSSDFNRFHVSWTFWFASDSTRIYLFPKNHKYVDWSSWMRKITKIGYWYVPRVVFNVHKNSLHVHLTSTKIF